MNEGIEWIESINLLIFLVVQKLAGSRRHKKSAPWWTPELFVNDQRINLLTSCIAVTWFPLAILHAIARSKNSRTREIKGKVQYNQMQLH